MRRAGVVVIRPAVAAVASPGVHVADRLTAAISRTGSVACVGLDPRPNLVPPSIREAALARHGDTLAALTEAFLTFNRGVIEAVAGRCAVVKPQVACYEAYGSAGWEVLEATMAAARSAGIEIIVDGKRNDIGSTAEHYRQGAFGGAPGLGGAPLPHVGLGGDWLTVNGYLGTDNVGAFLDDSAAHGVFVLVHTSNPSAAELQDIGTTAAAGGGLADGGGLTVAERLAVLVAGWGADRLGPVSGLSAVGAVVGATWPGEARRLRGLMAATPFLVPGYGAQGGSAADALAGARPGAGSLADAGLVVNSSRELLGAWQKAEDPTDWRGATTGALTAMNGALARAFETPGQEPVS